MNILITGGTGFIGTELREYLLRKEHFLTVITRSPDKYQSESANNQSFISWDDDLVSAMEQADVVVNLVGENIFGKRWTQEVKDRIYSSRIDTTRKLVTAAEEAHRAPELMISSSAVGYYGDCGSEIVDENGEQGQGFLPQVCADWEAAARPIKEAGVRLVIIRNGIVLETGGGALQYMLPIFKLGLGGPIGSGKQYFPWIHMLDVCRAIDFFIDEKGTSGVYNLNAPHPVTMSELANSLGDLLNRPSFFKAPEFALKIVLGEAANPLLDSLRVQPKRLQQAGFEFRFEYLREALSDIV